MNEYIINEDQLEAIKTNEIIGSVEKLVRCRDCIWSRIADGSSWPANRYKNFVGKTYCIIWGDEYSGEWVDPDGYCWKGEARE